MSKLTDLKKYPLRLVRGGRLSISSGNRCINPADELPVCEDEGVIQYWNDVLLGEIPTFSEIKALLLRMEQGDVNFVGTRDYVYSSRMIRLALERVEERMENGADPSLIGWNTFPRAGGLREAVMDSFDDKTMALIKPMYF
jgi:hypothetical protein